MFGKLEKAKFLLGNDAEVEVQFNPSSYSINCPKTVERLFEDLSSTRGIVSGVRNEARVLNFELVFDSYVNEHTGLQGALVTGVLDALKGKLGIESRTVQERVEELLELVELSQDETYGGLTFAWGEQVFHGILDNMSINYTVFLLDGSPARATISVSMTETPEPDGGIGGFDSDFGGFGSLGSAFGGLESLGSAFGDGLASMLPF